jgi:phosphatidylglycerophosphatase C
LKRGLAFFDFDGTITSQDTLFELIKFHKGRIKFYVGIIWISPLLILFKLKLVSAQKTKERLLTYFFADQPQSTFQTVCDQFIEIVLPGLLRAEALRKIEWHLKNNDRVIVVSASAYNWIQGWCDSINIELIATRLEFKNGFMTGRLQSRNCNGDEKVSRIKEYVDIAAFSPLYAYGDSAGDLPMLKIVEFPHYRKF